ncbi:MAG TPA: acetate--CoA ligase family protein [Thermoleophilaceae bacterium]|nr:acetate--CoA ligase family protein [Thermoleophilaceae bacterium]
MDLSRLLRPRSVAVVGASERDGSYAGETLLNLRASGFAGPVWGVNPNRSDVHGFACFPSLSELPEAPDAVVVGIPAPGVAEVVEEAGALGCGGAVVYGAGFGEVALGADHERALREAAARYSLPVCGPNGNGIVAVAARATLWGDTLRPLEAGPVALVSQSGNVAVNALASRRGLRFHTVVSCGNSAAVDPAEWVAALARDEGVRSIALYLEADGDGALLCDALAECVDRGVRVAVLKSGESPAGAAAAAAHTGAVAGDQRVFRALVEEAGAAWADDVHDLLELAKSLAVPSARRRPAEAGSPSEAGLAILTCSGGDSALAADEWARMGLALPALSADTAARLRELLPDAATVGNPLDYTALIWGDVELLRDIIVCVGADPAVGRVLIFYDQATDAGRGGSWAAVREGIRLGAADSAVPVMVSSTLPELLDPDAALAFIDAGLPAVAGLRTGLACAAALESPPSDPVRLREIAAATRATRAASGDAADAAGADAAAPGGDPAVPGPDPAAPGAAPSSPNGSRWLSELEAKELVRAAGVSVVDGRVVSGEDDAVVALLELGGHVAVKLSAPSLQHKAELGAVLVDLTSEPDVRAAHRRLTALAGVEGGVADAEVLVERMAPPGVELLVAARADAVVPCLVVGVGGIWTEALADAAVIPLPATPERVEAALLGLRSAVLFSGARGRPALDLRAAAELAAAAGDLLIREPLELIELNPVIVHERGAVAVDAVAAVPADGARTEQDAQGAAPADARP